MSGPMRPWCLTLPDGSTDTVYYAQDCDLHWVQAGEPDGVVSRLWSLREMETARTSSDPRRPDWGNVQLIRLDWVQNTRDPEGWEYEMGATTPGWYWWSCFPGCLPDSDLSGPFATHEEAEADAQEGAL